MPYYLDIGEIKKKHLEHKCFVEDAIDVARRITMMKVVEE